MDFQATDHARVRFRQRGIDERTVECLLRHGEAKHAHDGAIKISLTKRAAKEAIRALKEEIKKIERAQRKIIVEKDGQSISYLAHLAGLMKLLWLWHGWFSVVY